ncbi:MAG: hypothetical protein OWU33_05145 [Firmicutes bacterium]|nr:hypothetical protein [Bacillota bacterium]
MWWMRRRRTPWVIWLLALLGLKSLWRWSAAHPDPAWQAKRRKFRAKIDEAFRVWSQDSDEDVSPGADGE